MKNLLLLILALGVLAVAGCSRSDNQTTVKPQSTPDAERLRSDSERLQQATANAAKEREKAAQAQLSPTPTASAP
jgi:outer membrane murein-binding lipoprotein Lpp